MVLGEADLGVNGKDGSDRLLGNKRDNILDGGRDNDTIIAYRGNDTITTGQGRDLVDGGEGIDTVVYRDKLYRDSFIRKAGNIVNVDFADTLTNVEFIQFSDVRISTKTLNVTPILKGQEEIKLQEGDFGSKTAQLTFELSTPTSADVQFEYNTMDAESSLDAIKSVDYFAKSGQVTIPKGETTAIIDLEIIGNTVDEKKDLKIFGLRLSKISGATFEENQEETGVLVYIEDDDNALRINAGGNIYTDSIGQQWLASEGLFIFKNGQTKLTPNQISQTDEDILYQSEYFGKDFSFNFPVLAPSCSYEVTLRFAETDFSQPKQRIFDVSIEDQLVLDDFDIFAAAGGKNIPVSKTFDVEITDNSLDINFLASVDNAKISAIEFKPKSPNIKGCSWFHSTY